MLAAVGFASLAVGTRAIAPREVVDALVAFDGSAIHVVIREARIPRTVIGTTAGAALAVAGVLAQTLTHNPLAAPGILGINHGAALAAVAGVALLGLPDGATVLAAVAGAAVTAAVIGTLGSLGRGGLTPLRLTVAGAAITALLAGLLQALLVVDEQSLDQARRWLAGSLVDTTLTGVVPVALPLAAGFGAALALGRALNVFVLGDSAARALGQRTGRVRGVAVVAVVLLAGSAVAVAGPIAFLGLAVPHLSRWLVGVDHRVLLPHAALHGGILLVTADVLARIAVAPRELPVGVLTAVVGAPVFVHLARRTGGA